MNDCSEVTATSVSTARAAAALGKLVDTLSRWVKEGRIPEEMLRPMPRGFLWRQEWPANSIVFKFSAKAVGSSDPHRPDAEPTGKSRKRYEPVIVTTLTEEQMIRRGGPAETRRSSESPRGDADEGGV